MGSWRRAARNASALGLLAIASFLSSCTPPKEVPSLEVFVLVDLSETWHNAASDDRNLHVLQEIGAGIVQAADNREPPISVQYRPIGTESLDQGPLCDVLYEPVLVNTKKLRPDYQITKPAKLKSFLIEDCPAFVVGRPAQGLTRISAAFDSVAQKKKDPHTKRFIIVASDFFEEAGGPPPPLSDLHGSHVLLVYRPVDKDGQNPQALEARIDAWAAKLIASGATVEKISDTGLKAVDIANALND